MTNRLADKVNCSLIALWKGLSVHDNLQPVLCDCRENHMSPLLALQTINYRLSLLLKILENVKPVV